jgi:hypothetical protein
MMTILLWVEGSLHSQVYSNFVKLSSTILTVDITPVLSALGLLISKDPVGIDEERPG